MAKDITLKTRNGETRYPKSVTDLIFENGTGKTLQTIITELRTADTNTDTRTRMFKADVTNLDTLNKKTDIGLYNYVGNGWRGAVSINYDSADNVSQVALSSSTPSYNGNTLTWLSAQPCAMARTYKNGAWSHWEKVGAPVVNDLTTGGTDKALSAEMGKTLKEGLDALGPKIDQLDVDINGKEATSATSYTVEQNLPSAWKDYDLPQVIPAGDILTAFSPTIIYFVDKNGNLGQQIQQSHLPFTLPWDAYGIRGSSAVTASLTITHPAEPRVDGLSDVVEQHDETLNGADAKPASSYTVTKSLPSAWSKQPLPQVIPAGDVLTAFDITLMYFVDKDGNSGPQIQQSNLPYTLPWDAYKMIGSSATTVNLSITHPAEGPKEGLVAKVETAISNSASAKASSDLLRGELFSQETFSIADFWDGYLNTATASIGSTIDFIGRSNHVSSSSATGWLPVEVRKGNVVKVKMKSTSNQYCMSYLILDQSKKILDWAGRTSKTDNWLQEPQSFTIAVDGYIVLQFQKADYNANLNAPLSIERSYYSLDEQLDDIRATLDNVGGTPRFYLPKEIPMVQGERVLLFKSAMSANVPTNQIECRNLYCRDYLRYILVSPSVIGETNMTIWMRNVNGVLVGSQSVKLNVFGKPTNPQNVVNILCVGSSTTANYQAQYEELYRRLALTTGEEGNPANPKGLGLSNIRFIGRKSNGSNFRYEATGGFAWANYADPQGSTNNYAFTVENPSAYNQGAVYTDGTYDFTITEISQSNNRVSASCATQNAPIPASGSLTLKSGGGASSLVYSAYTATITHPFDLGNGVSLSDYMDAYCDGATPHIIVFQDLVVNSGAVLTEAIKTKITNLLTSILTDYPNVKILMSSEALPSLTGGLAANYVADSNSGSTFIKALQARVMATDVISFIEQFNEEYGSDVVAYVPKAIECDAEYDYPTQSVNVNNRVTSIQEKVGTNGWHPTNSGILNQVDAYYRSIAWCIKKYFN